MLIEVLSNGTFYDFQCCLDNCGDGGHATAARLTAPKGLAFDNAGHLYFVDGTRIRRVNANNGTITTFTGSLLTTGTRPVQCSGSMSVDQVCQVNSSFLKLVVSEVLVSMRF